MELVASNQLFLPRNSRAMRVCPILSCRPLSPLDVARAIRAGFSPTHFTRRELLPCVGVTELNTGGAEAGRTRRRGIFLAWKLRPTGLRGLRDGGLCYGRSLPRVASG
jgi:hypothetical protein